jgi:hypothetical protein
MHFASDIGLIYLFRRVPQEAEVEHDCGPIWPEFVDLDGAPIPAEAYDVCG